ncbi:acyltransferase family protein [Nocardioides ginsengisoli]
MRTTRDPWLDNAKMGLIVLVVLGHTWALLPFDGPVGHLYDFIYLWHMPAFILLSGYLSRSFAYSPARLWQLVTMLLVPYVLFEGALGWFRLHVGGERLSDLWTDPHFPMWYLLALVVWRLATPAFRRLAAFGGAASAIVVALGISVASGFLEGDWMSLMDLPRILGFLPFFVIGLTLTPDRLEWLRGRTPAVPRVLGVATFCVVALLALTLEDWAQRPYVYYRPFTLLGDGDLTAITTRLMVIAVGVAGAFAWLAVTPRVGGWFTAMGSATMVVYVFHGFAVKGLAYAGFGSWFDGRIWLGILAGLVCGLAIALGLAAPPVRRLLEHVVDPFGIAQRRVREAVRLAAVAETPLEAPIPAAAEAVEAEPVTSGR